MRRAALLLTVVLAASATPALADFLKVELTVAFFPPSTFSMDSHLAGSANFYIDIPGGNGPQPTDSPAPILFLDAWDRNVTLVEDSSLVDHPCITDGSCGVDTSVRGTIGRLAVFAFPNTADLPSIQPDLAPIIPIGSLALTDPCHHQTGEPCTQSGQLVAYDSGPVVLGTWNITMSEVPEPNGVVLLGIGILLLAWHHSARRGGSKVRGFKVVTTERKSI